MRPVVGELYLLFVPSPHGYALVEREGRIPAVGSEVELDDRGHCVVTKVAPSPLPGDARRCAYVQHAP
jgi:hypothetical protein